MIILIMTIITIITITCNLIGEGSLFTLHRPEHPVVSSSERDVMIDVMMQSVKLTTPPPC